MESKPEASVMPSSRSFLNTASYSKRPPVSPTALDESKKNDFEPSMAPARDAAVHGCLKPLRAAVYGPDEGNNGSENTNDRSDDIAYFKSLPPGYRFFPLDEELVVHYLRNKVMNHPLPRNRIMDVNVYAHNPDELAEMYKQFGEKEWYFFTPRDKKYRNGNRPNRAAGNGYWKATGADRDVCYKGKAVGSRKALVFYTGKPTTTRNSDTSKKTNWIMHEYRVKDAPRRSKSRGPNDMRLDDWVLCRIYKKADKVNAGQGRHKDQNRSLSPMIHQPDLDGDHDSMLNDVPATESKYDDPVVNSMVYAAGYMEQQSNAAAAIPDGGYLQFNSSNFVSNYSNFDGPVQHCGSNFVSNESEMSAMESFGLIPLPPIEGYIPIPFQDNVLDFTYYEDLPPALDYTNNISPYSEMVSLDEPLPPNNSPSNLRSPSGNNL